MFDRILIVMVLIGVGWESNPHTSLCSALPTKDMAIKPTGIAETGTPVFTWQETFPGKNHPGVLTITEIGNTGSEDVSEEWKEETDKNSTTIIGEQNRNDDDINRHSTVSYAFSDTMQTVRNDNVNSTIWRKKNNMDPDYSSESLILEYGPSKFPGPEIATNTIEMSTAGRTKTKSSESGSERIQSAFDSNLDANMVSESTSYIIETLDSLPHTVSSAESDSDATPALAFRPGMTPPSESPSEIKMTSTSYSVSSVDAIQDIVSTAGTSSPHTKPTPKITFGTIAAAGSTPRTTEPFEFKSDSTLTTDFTASQITADESLLTDSTSDVIQALESTSHKALSFGTSLSRPIFLVSTFTPETPLGLESTTTDSFATSASSNGIIPVSESIADTFQPSEADKGLIMASKFKSEKISTHSLTPESNTASDPTPASDMLLSSENSSSIITTLESTTNTIASTSATSSGTIPTSESKTKLLSELKSTPEISITPEASPYNVSISESNQEIISRLESIPDANLRLESTPYAFLRLESTPDAYFRLESTPDAYLRMDSTQADASLRSESTFYRNPSLESALDEFLRTKPKSDTITVLESRSDPALGSESLSHVISTSECTINMALDSRFSSGITMTSNSPSEMTLQPMPRKNSASHLTQDVSDITQNMILTQQSTTHPTPSSEFTPNITFTSEFASNIITTTDSTPATTRMVLSEPNSTPTSESKTHVILFSDSTQGMILSSESKPYITSTLASTGIIASVSQSTPGTIINSESTPDINSASDFMPDMTRNFRSFADPIFMEDSNSESALDVISTLEPISDLTSTSKSTPEVISTSESIAYIASVSESTADVTSPQESIPFVTTTSKFTPNVTSTVKTTLDVTSTPESISYVTSASESIPYLTSSSESIPYVTSSSESIPDVTSSSESTSDVISALEYITDIPLASDSIPDVTSVSEAIPDVTSASEPIPRVASASESIPHVISASEFIPDVTSASDSTLDVISTLEYITDVPSASESFSDVTTASESIPYVTSVPEANPNVTSASDSIPDVTSASESALDVISTLEYITDVPSASASFSDVTTASESIPYVTSVSKAIPDATSASEPIPPKISTPESIPYVTSTPEIYIITASESKFKSMYTSSLAVTSIDTKTPFLTSVFVQDSDSIPENSLASVEATTHPTSVSEFKNDILIGNISKIQFKDLKFTPRISSSAKSISDKTLVSESISVVSYSEVTLASQSTPATRLLSDVIPNVTLASASTLNTILDSGSTKNVTNTTASSLDKTFFAESTAGLVAASATFASGIISASESTTDMIPNSKLPPDIFITLESTPGNIVTTESTTDIMSTSDSTPSTIFNSDSKIDLSLTSEPTPDTTQPSDLFVAFESSPGKIFTSEITQEIKSLKSTPHIVLTSEFTTDTIFTSVHAHEITSAFEPTPGLIMNSESTTNIISTSESIHDVTSSSTMTSTPLESIPRKPLASESTTDTNSVSRPTLGKIKTSEYAADITPASDKILNSHKILTSESTIDKTSESEHAPDTIFSSPSATDITFAPVYTTAPSASSEFKPDLAVSTEFSPPIMLAREFVSDTTFALQSTPYLTFVPKSTRDITIASTSTVGVTVLSESTPDIAITSESTPNMTLISKPTYQLNLSSEFTQNTPLTSESIVDIIEASASKPESLNTSETKLSPDHKSYEELTSASDISETLESTLEKCASSDSSPATVVTSDDSNTAFEYKISSTPSLKNTSNINLGPEFSTGIIAASESTMDAFIAASSSQTIVTTESPFGSSITRPTSQETPNATHVEQSKHQALLIDLDTTRTTDMQLVHSSGKLVQFDSNYIASTMKDGSTEEPSRYVSSSKDHTDRDHKELLTYSLSGTSQAFTLTSNWITSEKQSSKEDSTKTLRQTDFEGTLTSISPKRRTLEEDHDRSSQILEQFSDDSTFTRVIIESTSQETKSEFNTDSIRYPTSSIDSQPRRTWSSLKMATDSTNFSNILHSVTKINSTNTLSQTSGSSNPYVSKDRKTAIVTDSRNSQYKSSSIPEANVTGSEIEFQVSSNLFESNIKESNKVTRFTLSTQSINKTVRGMSIPASATQESGMLMDSEIPITRSTSHGRRTSNLYRAASREGTGSGESDTRIRTERMSKATLISRTNEVTFDLGISPKHAKGTKRSSAEVTPNDHFTGINTGDSRTSQTRGLASSGLMESLRTSDELTPTIRETAAIIAFTSTSSQETNDDVFWWRWATLLLISVLCCSTLLVSFLSGMLVIYRQVNRQVNSSQRPKSTRQTPASLGFTRKIPAPLDYTRPSPAAVGSFRLPSTSGHRLLWSVSESVRDLERGQGADTLNRVPQAWSWVPYNGSGQFGTKPLPRFWNVSENKVFH